MSTRVPLPEDLEALPAPGAGLGAPRALWTELELRTLLRQLPEAPGGGRGLADEAPVAGRRGAGRLPGQGAGGRAARGGLGGRGRAAAPSVTRVGLIHPIAGDVLVAAETTRAAARPHPDRARREARCWSGGSRAASRPPGGGHRGGRVPPQLRAEQLQARGGVRRAPGRGAGARAARESGRAGYGSSGSRKRASCARPAFARSTTTSSARSFPSSPPWSATASPWIPPASPSSRRSWTGASAT